MTKNFGKKLVKVLVVSEKVAIFAPSYDTIYLETMKKYLILLAFVLSLGLSSCTTQQRAINQMRNLTAEVERNGEYYNAQDWQNAYQDYKDITAKIDTQKMTTEERTEYGELKGRLVAKFAKSSVKTITNAISEGAGVIQGILDGLTK